MTWVSAVVGVGHGEANSIAGKRGRFWNCRWRLVGGDVDGQCARAGGLRRQESEGTPRMEFW